MNVWRNSYMPPDGRLRGYHYVGSRKEAAAERERFLPGVIRTTKHQVELSKTGILRALNRHGGYPRRIPS